MKTPTEEAYAELQHAYTFFNVHLFANQLPPCLITLQRKNRTYGYFSGERWANQLGIIRDEIALNPAHFVTRRVPDVLATVVHEMVHLWQYHYGIPSRGGYHNAEWAQHMTAIGLIPSDSGLPGGKQTGQHMRQYIHDGGRFARACEVLLTHGFLLSWHARAQEETWLPGGAGPQGGSGKTPGTRTKYTCPGCGVNAWAKPHITLLCGTCQTGLMRAEEWQDAA